MTVKEAIRRYLDHAQYYLDGEDQRAIEFIIEQLREHSFRKLDVSDNWLSVNRPFAGEEVILLLKKRR